MGPEEKCEGCGMMGRFGEQCYKLHPELRLPPEDGPAGKAKAKVKAKAKAKARGGHGGQQQQQQQQQGEQQQEP